MSLKDVLRTVATELDRAGFAWALIGGLAISARLEPRFTRDIDLAVSVADDQQAEQLVKRFLGLGYSLHVLLEQETTGRLATVRLQTPMGEDGPIVDLLFASSGIEPETTQEAERIEVSPGLDVPVARLGHLLAMKILARNDERRPQDIIDIRNILGAASQEEMNRTRHARDRGDANRARQSSSFSRLGPWAPPTPGVPPRDDPTLSRPLEPRREEDARRCRARHTVGARDAGVLQVFVGGEQHADALERRPARP